MYKRVGTDRCWIALVCFERDRHDQEILVNDAVEGACGWIAAFVDNECDVVVVITTNLKVDGVKVISCEEIHEVSNISEIRERDEYLADNVESIEPEKCVVWGTVHGYYAEGEA